MLEKKIGVPVVAISAQKQENIDRLMDVCYNDWTSHDVSHKILTSIIYLEDSKPNGYGKLPTPCYE